MADTRRLLIGLFVLGLTAGCGSPQPEPPKRKQPTAKASQTKPTQQASKKKKKKQPKVVAPEYEIFEDSVDSTDGMRMAFVGTADGFTQAEQRAIVAEILEPERGKDRWVRVFVRANSARDQVQRRECLESLNAGTIIPCNFAR